MLGSCTSVLSSHLPEQTKGSESEFIVPADGAITIEIHHAIDASIQDTLHRAHQLIFDTRLDHRRASLCSWWPDQEVLLQ
jgi:hypothetical protein